MTQLKHLLHVFPSFAVGGSQMRFAQLVHLHGVRYRHTVIALDGNYNMAERLPRGAVTLMPIEYDKSNVIDSLRAFRAALKRVRPDVLMTYNWGAIEWAVINRIGRPIRHLHMEDGFGPEEATRQLRRRTFTRRLALNGSHTTVVLPSQTLLRIALTAWKLPQSRLTYIPNGINYVRFAGARETEGEVVTIGTVATLRREKNIARLIEAFSNVKNRNPSLCFNLLIVGDGTERANLEALAARAGLSDHVRFVGASPRPEDWLRKMDIFALSSDTEQMPLSLLEAMAAGLAIVATDVGDVSEMVSASNDAFVAEPGKPFECALERLALDFVLRQRIGAENAKKAAEFFDEAVMATRYAELMD